MGWILSLPNKRFIRKTNGQLFYETLLQHLFDGFKIDFRRQLKSFTSLF